MKIVINNHNKEYLETISLKVDDIDDLDVIQNTFNKFSLIKETLEAKIFTINESISSHKLSRFKTNFDKINVCILCLYSNDRDTILAGKSLKINSTYIEEQEVKNKLIQIDSKKKNDILYEGTIRSGDRISSNGNLCIIGDVNPGAIIFAKKNIYVWGKLLGIAFAGKGGNKIASIASLYLNPLQLRIADVIAIGPKEKPKNFYPEIALVENQTIIIKPYIIENKN